MTWYWFLLIMVVVQGIFLLVWWLVTRSSGAGINKELEDSTTKRLKEELEAERKKGEEVSAAYKTLTAKFREVAAWYNKNMDRITEEAADEFKTLAGDPKAVDAWLDTLIIPESRERLDPTKPNPSTDPKET